MSVDDRTSHFNIEPRLIVRYLISNGWKTAKLRNNLNRVWLPDNNNSEDIEVYFSENKRQQEREVYLALNTLSQLYDVSLIDMANTIRRLNFDLIFSRIPDEYVRNETIELRIASQFIEKMKLFLAASATTQLTGTRFYKRILKDGTEYSEKCRFGHTFRGSFGFQIESPVGFNDEPTLIGVDQPAPFERTVVRRIAKGLTSLVDAAKNEDPHLIVAEQDGLSSNMCDAVADIIDEIELSKLDMSISLSPEWRQHGDHEGKLNFSIHRKDVEILRLAAKSMRTEEAARSVSVYGRIKRLQTDGNPADLLEDKALREIELSWLNDDNQLLNVKMSLTPQDYLLAVEAHKNGSVVHAFGELVRRGRSWQLTDIQNFSVTGF